MSTLLLGYRRRSCPSFPRGGPLEFVIEYLKWRRGQPHLATANETRGMIEGEIKLYIKAGRPKSPGEGLR